MLRHDRLAVVYVVVSARELSCEVCILLFFVIGVYELYDFLLSVGEVSFGFKALDY